MEINACKDERYDFLVLRDVTSYKTHELELQQEIEEARNESQSKTTFLSKMSHEIRTPMNGIMGMLTLVKSKLKSDSPAIVYLNKAEELSEFLLSLINDILDMSRIEAGRMELESKEFDIYEFADKLRNMFQKNVEEKGVAFRVNLEMADDKTHYLIGDELRLSQVMINFLSNAMKFTSEGEIVVTIREMMRENNKVDLMMRVHYEEMAGGEVKEKLETAMAGSAKIKWEGDLYAILGNVICAMLWSSAWIMLLIKGKKMYGGKLKNGLQKDTADILWTVVFSGGLLLIIGLEIKPTDDYLPNEWSDFAFWSRLFTEKSAELISQVFR